MLGSACFNYYEEEFFGAFHIIRADGAVIRELRQNKVPLKGSGWVDGWMGRWVDGMLFIRRSLI